MLLRLLRLDIVDVVLHVVVVLAPPRRFHCRVVRRVRVRVLLRQVLEVAALL